jgi:hypothetical protein
VIVALPPFSFTLYVAELNCKVPPGAGSFSMMVSIAVLGEPRVAPPVGLLRVKLIVSLPSYALSSRIGTLKVLFAVSALAQLNVPLVDV